MDALIDIVPNAEHRNYVQHLYTNFKTHARHIGNALKDCLWKVSRSTTVKEFEDAMKKIKELSIDAHKWLEGKDPTQWPKSHFSTMSKCDMLLNILYESFNKYILETRDKPILTMMKTIRTKLMQRIAMKSLAAEKYMGPLCLKIQKKLEPIMI